jgi:hypothetical protein
MIDELINYTVLAVITLGGIFLTSYLHYRSEKRRKLDAHRPDMFVLNREPYSAQDAYTRRLGRQS